MRDAGQPSVPRVAREEPLWKSRSRWLILGAELAALVASAGKAVHAPPSQAPPSTGGRPVMVSSFPDEARQAANPGSIDISSAMRESYEAISHDEVLRAKLDKELANSGGILEQSIKDAIAEFLANTDIEPSVTIAEEIATQIKRPKGPPLPPLPMGYQEKIIYPEEASNPANPGSTHISSEMRTVDEVIGRDEVLKAKLDKELTNSDPKQEKVAYGNQSRQRA